MTDPVAAPVAAPAAAPAPAPAWYASHPDEAVRGWAETKGLTDANAALSTAFHAEKLIGHEKAGRTLVLPADENDAPGWQKVHERLGRPANAVDYKLPVPEGADAAFANEAAEVFHKHGVPLKTAQALTAWWNEKAGGFAQAEQTRMANEAAEEAAILDKDWGAEKAGRMDLARRAALTLGLDAPSIDAMQRGGGYAKTMKALAKVGDMLREAKAEGMGDIGAFDMTPEGAKSKRTQLMASKDWRAAAMVKDSAEWAEMQRLDRIIAAGKSVSA